MDLIYYSGNPALFIIAVDYSAYDSHCVYSNFRKPMIQALKDCYEKDNSMFNGFTRSEIVDKAYGEGRMLGTVWNIGRKVVITSADVKNLPLSTTETRKFAKAKNEKKI